MHESGILLPRQLRRIDAAVAFFRFQRTFCFLLQRFTCLLTKLSDRGEVPQACVWSPPYFLLEYLLPFRQINGYALICSHDRFSCKGPTTWKKSEFLCIVVAAG